MNREVHVPDINPSQIKAPSREIFAAMGEENIERMLEAFYLELDKGSPELRALFPTDMVVASRKSAAFFIGLLGGPPRYHERHGNPMMRARHMPFAIDEARRQEWLDCFNRVLDHAVERYAFPAQHLAGFRDFLAGFSMWMVNTR